MQDKERRKIEREMGAALEEKEKKFSMMKEVLDSDTPVAKPRTFKTPATSVKTRTYTTPGDLSDLCVTTYVGDCV